MKHVSQTAHAGESDRNFDVAVDGLYRWADGPNNGELAFVKVAVTTAAMRYNELIPAADCSMQGILHRHPDLWVSRKGRDGLRAYLATLVTNRLQKSDIGWAFSQTGFHQLEDRTVFVAGDRLIGDGALDFVISSEAGQFHLGQSPLPPGETAEALIRRLEANGFEVTAPVFAFGLLTALQSLVMECGIPLTSVLYLRGQSGFGKTTTVRKFFALYDASGDQGLPALITEAGSTMAGFRENLRSARDLPVVLDDLCLSSARDSQRKRLELGAQAVREASNKGAVRTRMGEHGQKLSTEAGVAITAEFDLGTISDLNRCNIVRIDRPMENGRDDDRMIAAGALDAFLTWFVQRYQRERDALRQHYETAVAQTRLGRLETGLFCLQWAFDRFLHFAMDVGAVNQLAQQQMRQAFRCSLKKIEDDQCRMLNLIDAKIPKHSIPTLLWEGIRCGQIPLTKKKKKLDESHGLLQGDNLFLMPVLLERFVCAQDGYQGISRNRITRELKAAGVLVLHQNDRANTIKLKKGLPRMVHIKMGLLQQAAESGLLM